jgi:uncharacterized protein (TIGR02453 family)
MAAPSAAAAGAAPRGRPLAGFAGFRPAALKYLRALKRHNERAWFIEHRETYDQEVLGPLRDFVSEIDDRLARVAPEICGDAKRSVFRIYRDVRFSHDKRPYKTHAACWFFHRDSDPKVGRDGGGAGFYFHIEPGNSQIGGGLWMPGREVLTILRDTIAEDPAGFVQAADSKVMRRRFGGLDPERVLTRMPRGFSDQHEAAKWLRYQSFTAGRMLTDSEVIRPDLASRVVRDYVPLVPLVRWLNSALGLQPAARR